MTVLKSCLNKVSDWQFMGEISSSPESLTSKINQAFMVNEISNEEKNILASITPQLVTMVAGLQMADIYRAAKRIKADEDEGDPDESMPSVVDGQSLDRPCDNCGMKLSGHSGHWANGGFLCDSCFGGLGYGGSGILGSKIAEVQPEEIDILIYGLNQLTDVIANSGDEDLVMVQKLLADFLQNLKTELQTSSKDQLNYEHADDEQVNPSQGTEPTKRETATPGGMG